MKLFYIILGSTALALGMLGIFLPLLPTTPFLLLSAWFYCKGSDRLYGWLMSHPYLGSYIRNYREKRAITLQSKATAVSLMFVTILICILFVAESLWLKILLAAIFAAGTSSPSARCAATKTSASSVSEKQAKSAVQQPSCTAKHR